MAFRLSLRNRINKLSKSPQKPTILDQDIIGVNTTEDGNQVFLAIGDSNMAGSSGQDSVVVPENIMYKWTGSEFQMVTDGVSGTAGNASMFEEFIISYNSRTGYKGGFVNRGLSSTAFGPNGTDFNLAWAGTARYTQAVTEVNEACAEWGLTKPRAIVICLGANDVSLNTPVQYYDQVFDDLTNDFPGVPIIVIQPGKRNSTPQESYNVKTHLIEQVRKRDNAWMVCNSPSITTIVDALHYDQTGLGDIGKMIDRLLDKSNSGYSKWVRSIIASQFDDLTTERKEIVNRVFTRQIENGNYWKLEYLYVMQTSDERNIKNCFAFLGGFSPTSYTFNANNNIESNSSSSVLYSVFKPTVYNLRSSSDDLIVGIRLGGITTAASTNAHLFGAIDANAGLVLRKGNGTMNYQINDLTSVTVNVAIQEHSMYAIARSGDTRRLLMNSGTVLHESEQAVTGTSTTLSGTHLASSTNSSGVPQGRLAAEIKYSFAAQHDGFNLEEFYEEMEYWIANW